MANNLFVNAEKEAKFKLLYPLLLLILVGGVFFFSQSRFKNDGEELIDLYNQKDSIIEQAINSADTLKVNQIQKLEQQYLIIKKIKKPYLNMVQKFHAYNYAFTLTFTLTSIISGILAFLIVKKGWDYLDNYYLKVSFFVMFFCSSFLGILPNVFNNKENAKNNLSKVNYYNGLQFQIFDLVNDNRGLIKNHRLSTLDSLISVINTNIVANQDLHIDTKIEEVPKDIKPLTH